MTARRSRWLRRNWPSAALVVLLLVPAYVIAGSVVVRGELKPSWAGTSLALGLVAATLGATFAWSSHRRRSDRQRLDTTLSVLDLIKHQDRHADPAVTGAAISTLVVLGYPTLALRALHAAMRRRAVDSASAVWVIDEVLARPRAASRSDAVALLHEHAEDLTDESVRGVCDWPSAARGRWPGYLSREDGWLLVQALLRLLVSRPAGWWTAGAESWTWVPATLYHLTEEPTATLRVRQEAAGAGLILLAAVDGPALRGAADEVFEVADLVKHFEGVLKRRPPPAGPVLTSWLEGWVNDARGIESVAAGARRVGRHRLGPVVVESLSESLPEGVTESFTGRVGDIQSVP